MGTRSTAARNAALNSDISLLIAGSGDYPMYQILDASDNVLVSVDLDDAAPATVSNGVMTLAAPYGESTWEGYKKTPAQNGTAAKVVLADTDGNAVITQSVGIVGSGEEVILPSLSIVTTTDIEWSAAPTVTQIATYDPTP